MKAVILARVSTEEQREAGNSLPAQIHRLEEYCKRRGFGVLKIYSFDESAYKLKRDEFDKALDFIKESKEKLAVCFDKVDRFTRNVFDKRVPLLYELAMQDKIELHFASDNLVINSSISAQEKFQFGISLNLAKYYSDAVSDNTKRALEQKLRNGEWIGQAHLGYLNNKESGKGCFRLDPPRAELIRKMFELYATGNYSIKTLQKETIKLGLTSRTGKALNPSTIHKILKDKFYIGIMISKGREYPHKYPPIITRELFDRVQSILASYQKKKIKYAAKPFALRGLVHCERCGCTITAEIKKGRYVYYSCSNFKGQCERVWVPEGELLNPIRKVLKGLKMDQERVDTVLEELQKVNEAKNAFHAKAVHELRAEYDKLQANLDRLVDLLVETSITREIYDKKVNEYKEKQYDINIRLEEYTRADENFHIAASMVFSLANRALEIFESSEVNEKRQLLNILLQNCRLSGKNLLFELRSPFDEIYAHADHPSVLRGRDSNPRPIGYI
jgi:site-specific DNA recombinase